MTSLGRLTPVDLRTVWASETGHFTPWLARPENIGVLGEAIGMGLEVEATERSVGPFRADILCKDVDRGNWVLIENQLEATDHTHLGQLLTYATGLDAVVVVWVASSFKPEHRASLQWLNEITDDRFNFFGLEIELWKIGESPVAPKFNVVCRPDNWSRSISSGARSIEAQSLGPTMAKQFNYWTRFNDMLRERKGIFRAKTPQSADFMTFGTGTGSAPLLAVASSRRVLCGVVLHPPVAKALFGALRRKQIEIESALGHALEWREMPGRKESQIVLRLEGATVLDEKDWPRQHEWLINNLERFHAVFAPRLPQALAEALAEGSGDE